MFPKTYFCASYFAPTYFPEIGAVSIFDATIGTSAIRIETVGSVEAIRIETVGSVRLEME